MPYRRADNLDKNIIFAEYFNSEQEVRRNGGGVVDNVTFDKGVITIDGSTSEVFMKTGVIPLAQGYSLRAKVKTSGSAVGQLFCQDDETLSDRERVFQFRFDADGKIRFIPFEAGPSTIASFTTTSSYNNGEWHEVIVTYDPTDGSVIYVDGISDGSDASTGNHVPIETGISVGHNYNSTSAIQNILDGDLSLVEIYNKALTAEEVSNLYNDARYVMPNLEKSAQGDGTDLNVSACENQDYDTFTNVSRTGFSVTCDGSIPHNVGTADEIPLTDGGRVLVSFDFVINSGNVPIISLRKNLGGTFVASYTSGQITTSKHYDIILESNWGGDGVIDFINNFTSGDWSISNLSVQNLAVEPTSKILHVTAKNGVVQNLLSGDSVDEIDISDFSEDTDNYTVDSGSGGTWTRTYGYDGVRGLRQIYTALPSSSALRPIFRQDGIFTVGKRYRIIITADQAVINRVYDGTTILDTGMDYYITPTNPWIFDFTSTDTDLQLYFSCSAEPDLQIKGIDVYEIIPEVSNTDIEVVKEGAVRTPRFNGSTSKIDCGDYNDLTGDITVLAWFKTPHVYETTTANEIISNGQMLVEFRGQSVLLNEGILFSSNTSTVAKTAANILDSHEYYFVAIVRKADGTVNMYIDGEASGTANQASGTPVAGDSNIHVGALDGLSRWYKSNIPEVIVVDGLLTAEEISQYYTATKHLYGK